MCGHDSFQPACPRAIHQNHSDFLDSVDRHEHLRIKRASESVQKMVGEHVQKLARSAAAIAVSGIAERCGQW